MAFDFAGRKSTIYTRGVECQSFPFDDLLHTTGQMSNFFSSTHVYLLYPSLTPKLVYESDSNEEAPQGERLFVTSENHVALVKLRLILSAVYISYILHIKRLLSGSNRSNTGMQSVAISLPDKSNGSCLL